jgi:hypothetical protein
MKSQASNITGIELQVMTTIALLNIRCLKMAATIVVTTAAFAASFVMAFAIGAAAAQSTDPMEIAQGNDAAAATPYLATRQISVPVSGVLTAPGGGPLVGHELHFQDSVAGDIYTVRTRAGGAFSTRLPQGVYDLRGEHGAVIASCVIVDQNPINLGQVHPPPRYNVWRWLDRQEVGPEIVDTPPATAYLPGAGEGPQPVAVVPKASPPVVGGGPGGKPLPPAVVIPPQLQYRSDLPSGAEMPAPDMPSAEIPPAQEMPLAPEIPPEQEIPPAQEMPPGQEMAPGAPGANGSGY